MAFDITQEMADFRDIELDEFGESVVYTNGITAASKTILAIRPTPEWNQMKPGRTEFHQMKSKMDLLVSRLDITSVNKGKDTVTLKVEPDDVNAKTLLVTYCTDEYGAWRLGLV
jgi:hypothetical protein